MTDDVEDPPLVMSCQGPPLCMLEGDEAIAAQEGGCIWCTRIWIFPDGHVEVAEPAQA